MFHFTSALLNGAKFRCVATVIDPAAALNGNQLPSSRHFVLLTFASEYRPQRVLTRELPDKKLQEYKMSQGSCTERHQFDLKERQNACHTTRSALAAL